MSLQPQARALTVALAIVLGLVALAVTTYLVRPRADRLPTRDSQTYSETTRSFYRGLAALEVGLLDDAATAFTRATELVPVEAASWANLGLTYLRGGQTEEAVEPLERARALAPASAEIALIEGLAAGSRGRLDEGIAHLRRAVDLDPGDVRVRFALAEALERAGGPDGDVEAKRLLEAILEQQDNLSVRLEGARLAAKRSDGPELRDAVVDLGERTDGWPSAAVDQHEALVRAADDADFTRAATAIAVLRNVLVRLPAFRESLTAVQVPPELIAEPLEQFLTLPAASATASPADETLTYSPELMEAFGDGVWSALVAVPLIDAAGAAPPMVFAATGREVRRLDATTGALPFPGGEPGVPPSASGLLALDWNHDFRPDLVLAGSGGLRLLIQGEDGGLTDATMDAADTQRLADTNIFGAWAADIEMDGDLDIVVGVTDDAVRVLRNNGDGTWSGLTTFAEVVGLRSFAWGDLDRDGDPDAALLDADGNLHLFANQQAGRFSRWQVPDDVANLVAITIADANTDGQLDLVALAADGVVSRVSADLDGWDRDQIAEWRDQPAGCEAGSCRLLMADLDNNGALDLVASGASRTAIWLADERITLRPFPAIPDAEIFGIVDGDGDGTLDLLGLSDGRPLWLRGRGTRDYHWQLIRPRAQRAAGDQRINSFGVGGEVEIRAGLSTQKQVLTGAPVHFGLGAHDAVDVIRIIWPNGVMQAEFDLPADDVIVAEQRLKGSCPWVFSYNGTGHEFVTDFLWRSPLGLRINAQDTAQVSQTEDWVKIRGDQLVPRDGFYDIRITAELWETHFFDHVSLLVVDHPEDVEVFVDERFAREAPVLAVHATRPRRSVTRAWDETGRDVTPLVTKQDGRYLATFEPGAYQGVAGDHFVEFELGEDLPGEGPLWLLAHGWVYPTDSSINVAMGQGHHPRPRGLSLEARNGAGGWRVVHPDLGFPAGKNKTIVVDLTPARPLAGVGRLRLRTNLEVYWDWLGYAAGVEVSALDTKRVNPATADLRYRGFSQTTYDGRRDPEVPRYDRLANITQRWRDLVGYHTRFGDVRELLYKIDDRYVIMNAGDELRLQFPVPRPAPEGHARDFVLIGDGWVKDGDYNTTFSKTLRPLPAHSRIEYDRAPASFALEDDPVYRRHPADWQKYHTRFVTPQRFLRGFRRDSP